MQFERLGSIAPGTLKVEHLCANTGSVIVDSLLIAIPIVEFCKCSMFCCALLCVHSSFAIVSMGDESWLLCLVCLPGVS